MLNFFTYIANKVSRALEDIAYTVKWASMHVLGKSTVKGLAMAAHHTAASGAESAAAGAATGAMASMAISGPLSAVVSSSIVQSDHLHRRAQVLEDFTPEMAAGFGVQEAEVGEKHLGWAALANPVIKEALDHSAKERNVGVIISVLSSLAGAAVVGNLTMGDGPLAGLDYIPKVLAAGAAGFATYLPISTSLHWTAEKFFGLEHETSYERIQDIRRSLEVGKNVSRERVFEVFAHAQPAIDEHIRETYGRCYKHLPAVVQQHVLDTLAPQIGLDDLTQKLNDRIMRPEELAFSVEGQHSGVPLEGRPGERITHTNHLSLAWSHLVDEVTAVHKGKDHSSVEQEAPPATPPTLSSFVARVGGPRHAGATPSFVQRITQAPLSPEIRAV